MKTKRIDPRREAMAAAYRSGLTLQAIGDKYGLTRERVRQLLSGLVSADEVKSARDALKANQKTEKAAADKRAQAQRESAFVAATQPFGAAK